MANIYAKHPILVNVSLNDTYNMGILKFSVSIHEKGASAEHVYEFQTSATRDDHDIDISSAFRAEFIRQGDITPDNCEQQYKLLYGEVKVSVEYLSDGVLVTKVLFDKDQDGNPQIFFDDVRRGGLTDEQRFFDVTDNDATISSMTLKPAGEVIGPGIFFGPETQSSRKTEVSAAMASIQDQKGRSIHVDNNPMRKCFAFVNSFGLVESASAVMLESKSYKFERSEFALAGRPSYAPTSRHKMRTTSRRSVWKMSSGYNTREWIDWWANEFCTSEQHWMLIDGKWLPVTIDAGDETTIYDKAKGELCAVNFTVRSAY